MPPLSLTDIPINLSEQSAVDNFSAYLDKNEAKNYPEVKEKMKTLLKIIMDTKKKSTDVNTKIQVQTSKIADILSQIKSLKVKIEKLIKEVPDIDKKDLDKLDNEIAEKIDALTKQLKNELSGIGKDAENVDTGLEKIKGELASIPTAKSKEEAENMVGGKKRKGRKTKKKSVKNKKTKKGGYIWKFNKKTKRKKDKNKKRKGFFGKTISKTKTRSKSRTRTY